MKVANLLRVAALHLLPARQDAAPAVSLAAAGPLSSNLPAPRRAIAMPLQAFTASLIHRLSPLIGETDPAAADTLNALYRSNVVQAAAAAYKLKVERLFDVACYRAAIATAISFATEKDLGPSPEIIAEILRGMAESAEEELDAARADHAAHDAASKVALERHRPLREVVSARLTAMADERNSLDRSIDDMRRAAGMGFTGGRYAELLAAGLSPKDIAAVSPETMDPDATIAVKQERMREIAGILPRLCAFSADPLHSAEHLAGMSEFDALVIERDGYLPVVECVQ